METVRMRLSETDECPNCLTSDPECSICGTELQTEYEAICDFPNHYCMDCYRKVQRGEIKI